MANYLNLPENEEFSKYYEYTVDYRAVSNNFIAKFRLKRKYMEKKKEEDIEEVVKDDVQETVTVVKDDV